MHREQIGELYNYLVSEQTYKFIVNTYKFKFILPLLTRAVLRFKNKKALLVFGMSRSGTSMLATLLSVGESSFYLHEPDTEMMKFRYGPGWDANQKAFWDFVDSEAQKDFKVHLMTCLILRAALKADRSIQTICVKPISLLDAMPEVSHALSNAQIIYISRHPAGRSESIVRQLLGERKADQPIQSTVEERLASWQRLGQSWGATNKKVLAWFRQHPGWRWVFFEDLTRDPLGEFKKLYNEFGLSWDETIEAEIKQRTTGKDGGFYEVQRDASKQADKWRTRLTEEELDAIRKGSLPFETNLYEGF